VTFERFSIIIRYSRLDDWFGFGDRSVPGVRLTDFGIEQNCGWIQIHDIDHPPWAQGGTYLRGTSNAFMSGRGDWI
jgi:hypothetical protein